MREFGPFQIRRPTEPYQARLPGMAEWMPAKKRQPGPMDLLALIRTMVSKYVRVGCRARVAWFADHFQRCERTIQRWLRKLSPFIEQIERGWHRAAQYKLVPFQALPKVSPQTVTPERGGHYYPNSGVRILKLTQVIERLIPVPVRSTAQKRPPKRKRSIDQVMAEALIRWGVS